MNRRLKFYKLTNLTVFAVLIKDIAIGFKGTFLPDSISKNCTINCLTSAENTRQPNSVFESNNLCFFRALALQLHGNQQLDETSSKTFNLFISRVEGVTPGQFQGVHKKDITFVEDLLKLNTVLYDKKVRAVK